LGGGLDVSKERKNQTRFLSWRVKGQGWILLLALATVANHLLAMLKAEAEEGDKQ
jgi:hypothetical protein